MSPGSLAHEITGLPRNQSIRGICHARRKYRMGNAVFGYKIKGYKWIVIPYLRLPTLKITTHEFLT
jgi:hypothetical protein